MQYHAAKDSVKLRSESNQVAGIYRTMLTSAFFSKKYSKENYIEIAATSVTQLQIPDACSTIFLFRRYYAGL